MIKTGKLLDLFPPSRRVAGVAGRLKCTLVGVPVTVTAAAKGNSLVFRHSRGVPGEEMTFLTRHLLVKSCQRKRSPLMIEPSFLFPGLKSMTGSTVLPQLAVMHIFMTGGALL